MSRRDCTRQRYEPRAGLRRRRCALRNQLAPVRYSRIGKLEARNRRHWRPERRRAETTGRTRRLSGRPRPPEELDIPGARLEPRCALPALSQSPPTHSLARQLQGPWCTAAETHQPELCPRARDPQPAGWPPAEHHSFSWRSSSFSTQKPKWCKPKAEPRPSPRSAASLVLNRTTERLMVLAIGLKRQVRHTV